VRRQERFASEGVKGFDPASVDKLRDINPLACAVVFIFASLARR
jgi:hypothetical protein